MVWLCRNLKYKNLKGGKKYELREIAIIAITQVFFGTYHDVTVRVKPYFERLPQVTFSLELIVNFINKIKYLYRIKPYIEFLPFRISLNRRFPLNSFYFSQFSQILAEMDLKVDLLKL